MPESVLCRGLSYTRAQIIINPDPTWSHLSSRRSRLTYFAVIIIISTAVGAPVSQLSTVQRDSVFINTTQITTLAAYV